MNISGETSISQQATLRYGYENIDSSNQGASYYLLMFILPATAVILTLSVIVVRKIYHKRLASANQRNCHTAIFKPTVIELEDVVFA